MNPTIQWLLDSDEPWTRYRTRIDLLHQPEDDPLVQADRAAMLAHTGVQSLIAAGAAFPERPIKRHNDAAHPLYALSTLADFGLNMDDPGIESLAQTLLSHQSIQGAFQSLVNVARVFGGSGNDEWSWMACDAPTLLYILLAFGLEDDPRVQKAVGHLEEMVSSGGWRCVAAPELGKFRGPGRKADACPIANVYALKALSQANDKSQSPAVQYGAEMLLQHWAAPRGEKYYLFGIGSTFRKPKYPYVWYDLLHVTEVLSRFPFVRCDERYQSMKATLLEQAGEGECMTAGSMYQAWKGWSFADKKKPSPWLTFLMLRISQR